MAKDPNQEMAEIIVGASAAGRAALEGVMAICARLAMKDLFDGKDIEKVREIMLKAIGDDPDSISRAAASQIEARREELDRIISADPGTRP